MTQDLCGHCHTPPSSAGQVCHVSAGLECLQLGRPSSSSHNKHGAIASYSPNMPKHSVKKASSVWASPARPQMAHLGPREV